MVHPRQVLPELSHTVTAALISYWTAYSAEYRRLSKNAPSLAQLPNRVASAVTPRLNADFPNGPPLSVRDVLRHMSCLLESFCSQLARARADPQIDLACASTTWPHFGALHAIFGGLSPRNRPAPPHPTAAAVPLQTVSVCELAAAIAVPDATPDVAADNAPQRTVQDTADHPVQPPKEEPLPVPVPVPVPVPDPVPVPESPPRPARRRSARLQVAPPKPVLDDPSSSSNEFSAPTSASDPDWDGDRDRPRSPPPRPSRPAREAISAATSKRRDVSGASFPPPALADSPAWTKSASSRERKPRIGADERTSQDAQSASEHLQDRTPTDGVRNGASSDGGSDSLGASHDPAVADQSPIDHPVTPRTTVRTQDSSSSPVGKCYSAQLRKRARTEAAHPARDTLGEGVATDSPEIPDRGKRFRTGCDSRTGTDVTPKELKSQEARLEMRQRDLQLRREELNVRRAELELDEQRAKMDMHLAEEMRRRQDAKAAHRREAARELRETAIAMHTAGMHEEAKRIMEQVASLIRDEIR